MDPDELATLDRRRFLRWTTVAGAAGVGGLAGCTEDGGDGTTTTTGGAGGDTTTDGTTPGDGTTTDGDGTTTADLGDLEIVHWWTAGGEQQALDALLEGFRETYPSASVTNNPAPGGAGSALDTVIKNRVLNQNPPSTFQIWPGQSLHPYVEADVLDDVGDSVWTDEVVDAYLPGVRALAQPQGNYVCVPLNIHRLNNLFYNASVVESAGVDPAVIDSPGALMDAMSTVESETDAVGMAHQTQAAWSTIQLWEDVLVGQSGVGPYQDVLAGNVADNEDAVRSALQTVADYREYFNQDAGSISWDQANSRVINGDAAFIHQGDWAAGQYKATDGFDFRDGWDYVPFPGTSGVYHIVSDSFVKPEPNPSGDTTTAFLRYCASVDGQERFNPIKGSIPPRTDVPTDPFGPFLSEQIDDFGNSESQPPTIAHGTAVIPEVKSNIEGAFASFIENWNVDSTYTSLRESFST